MSREHILSVQHKNAKVKVAKLFHQQDSLRKLLLDGTTGICLHWAPCTVPDYVENSKTFRSQTSFARDINSTVHSIANGYCTLLVNAEWARQEVKLNSPVVGCHAMLLKLHFDSGTSTRCVSRQLLLEKNAC